MIAKQKHQLEYLTFDIETIPHYENAKKCGIEIPAPPKITPSNEMPPFDPQISVEGFKILIGDKNPDEDWLMNATGEEQDGKDRKGIHDVIAKKMLVEQEFNAKRDAVNKLCATTPELLKIVALGVKSDHSDINVFTSDNEPSEVALLEIFWRLVLKHKFVIGFNCIHFDIPAIIARSLMLNVSIKKHFDMSSFRPNGVIDIYRNRFGKYAPSGDRPKKLKLIAPLYGIEVASNEDGSNVLEMVNNSQWEKLAKYCMSDVFVTWELFLKWRGAF